jgi:hypothetical protein
MRLVAVVSEGPANGLYPAISEPFAVEGAAVCGVAKGRPGSPPQSVAPAPLPSSGAR